MLGARAGERVRDLVQDRIAHLGLVVEPHERRGEPDDVGVVAADPGASPRPVELQAPAGQPVLGDQRTAEAADVGELHGADPRGRR